MKTLIIGKRSNLSTQLSNQISNSSTLDFEEVISFLKKIDDSRTEKINIIFNQFQPATLINDISNPTEYIRRSIFSTAQILDSLKRKTNKVNKIIYTSSSSVYGNNPSCKETDIPAPISLHATLKLSNEKLLSRFCEDHSINLTIARVFNMYAGKDEFSIVSKIIRAIEQSHTIKLINQGRAIRDFIHIDDVVNSYQRILLTKQTDQVINIASGQGISVAEILDHILQQKFTVSTHNIEQDEIQISIANNERLQAMMGQYNFRSVKDYVLNELRT